MAVAVMAYPRANLGVLYLGNKRVENLILLKWVEQILLTNFIEHGFLVAHLYIAADDLSTRSLENGPLI